MKDLAKRLDVLGLSEKEALLYLDVLAGVSRPADVAKDVKRDRADVSRSLEDLARRGFLNATLERPVRYQAVEPDVLFNLANAQLEAKRVATEDARDRVHNHFLTRAKQPTLAHLQRQINGRLAASAEFTRFVSEAKTSLWTITTTPRAVRTPDHEDGRAISRIPRERLAGGLKFRSITTLDQSVRASILELVSAGAEVRHLCTKTPIGLAIKDGAEALMWKVIDPSERPDASGDVAVYTTAEAAVRGYEIFFDALAETAQPAEQYLAESRRAPLAEATSGLS